MDTDPAMCVSQERRVSSRSSMLEDKFWREFMGVDPKSDDRKRMAQDLPTLREKLAEIDEEYDAIRGLKQRREADLARLS
jgi:hypothetical protein